MRWIAGAACRATGNLARVERANAGTLIVLCYHRVLPRGNDREYFLPDLVVTPEALRCHLSALVRRYEVMTLRDAWERMAAGSADAARLAAITFDDGYEDNYRFAAPVLAEFGVPATFFVVTDIIGTDRAPWYDQMGHAVKSLVSGGRAADVSATAEEFGGARRSWGGDVSPTTAAADVVRSAKALSPARRREMLIRLQGLAQIGSVAQEWDRFMNWSQVQELASCGHEIGSHTRTHELLTQLDDCELENELVGSMRALEEMVPQRSYSFCYPNGDVDQRVASAVHAQGYTCAVTVENGINTGDDDPFLLRRRFMHGDRLRGLWGDGSGTLTRMVLAGATARLKKNFGKSIQRLCTRGAF